MNLLLGSEGNGLSTASFLCQTPTPLHLPGRKAKGLNTEEDCAEKEGQDRT